MEKKGSLWIKTFCRYSRYMVVCLTQFLEYVECERFCRNPCACSTFLKPAFNLEVAADVAGNGNNGHFPRLTKTLHLHNKATVCFVNLTSWTYRSWCMSKVLSCYTSNTTHDSHRIWDNSLDHDRAVTEDDIDTLYCHQGRWLSNCQLPPMSSSLYNKNRTIRLYLLDLKLEHWGLN